MKNRRRTCDYWDDLGHFQALIRNMKYFVSTFFDISFIFFFCQSLVLEVPYETTDRKMKKKKGDR